MKFCLDHVLWLNGHTLRSRGVQEALGGEGPLGGGSCAMRAEWG